jgi:hypothetical protein
MSLKFPECYFALMMVFHLNIMIHNVTGLGFKFPINPLEKLYEPTLSQ